MTLTGPDVRILQVHPTRLCNLRCLHCYSSSGPQERGELGASLLLQAVNDASRLGYNVLSVSGGEPLLYSQLASLCREARRNQMLTTLVTNGTVITPRKMDELRGLVDMLAISLDGMPERHNRIRGSQRAFEQMANGVELVRQAGIPFAFVFTLTQENLHDLKWAAGFAAAQGALMLQVHPLEEFGRACSDLRGQALPARQMGAAWMMVEYLRELHRHKLMIHLDTLSRYQLPDAPGDFDEMVSPLVIEDDGTVAPWRYGFPRAFAFGSLHTRTLLEMAPDWKRRHERAFRDLYREALRKVRGSDQMFVNIYEMMAEEAAETELVALSS
jgi:MoaA/NifB/PqqE/SkfB family radical SAM enzyme